MQSYFILLYIILGCGILYELSIFAFRYFEYQRSPFYKKYGHKFFSVVFNRGKYFEANLYSFLIKQGINNILMNVVIPVKDKTTEIDCIFEYEGSCFVLEVKDYSGVIYGSEKRKEWTKYVYGRKYRFQNPLHQNYGHVQAIKTLLNKPDLNLVSLVLFNKRGKLKKPIPNVVLGGAELLDTIKKPFPKCQMNVIELLSEYENGDIAKHVQNLQKN